MSSPRGSVVSPHETPTIVRPEYGLQMRLVHCIYCGSVLDVQNSPSIRQHEDFHTGLAKLAAALSAKAVS